MGDQTSMRPLAKKYLERSKQAQYQNLFSKALDFINSALYIAPNSTELIECKLEQLKYLGHFNEAAILLTEALEHDFCCSWGIELAELYINHLSKPKQALTWLGRLLYSKELSSEEEQKVFLLEAEALFEQQRFYEAWLKLRQACRKYPENKKILFWYGWVNLQLERFYPAALAFRKLIKSEPKHVDAHYYLGVVYESLGEFSLMKRQFSLTHCLDLACPPEPRFEMKEVLSRVEEILEEEQERTGNCLDIQVFDYPRFLSLKEHPHDPRRIAVLLPTPVESEIEQKSLVLYLWNIDRYCRNVDQLCEEIRFLLREEYTTPPKGLYENLFQDPMTFYASQKSPN